jgi:LacI family transcriptional regulator
MANIYQVAELAGVSSATVSRIINNKSRVTDKTRRKVQAAMKELGYRPNPIAQALATSRTNCVGVLVSELSGPFYGAMLSAIEETLRSAGKFVIVTAGHNDATREQQAVQFLADRNCDALILHVEALSDQQLGELAAGSVPVVIVNRAVPGLADRCISLDNRRGGYHATKLLLQHGHHEIAYISGPLQWHDAAERLAGHKRALAEAGLDLDAQLLYEGDFLESGGAAGLAQLLERRVPFSALACANDEMAVGAMAVARTRGLNIPADLSIVGFDNAPISRYVHPKLATVDYPIAEMSRMAATWVLRNVYGDDGAGLQHMFEPAVIERESVRMVLRSQPPATRGICK